MQEQQKTLDKLKPGESGTVTHVSGEGAIFRRLLDMGFTPGAPVKVVKVAPLGDPVELTLRGYQISVRKAEAKHITVEM